MSTKVAIQDVIDLFLTKSELDKEKAEDFSKAFFAVIEEALEKDRYIKIKGLGTFKLVDVENRESINVNTGERFEIQGHTKITFTPENAVRDLINKPFAHFETVILNDDVSFQEPAKKEESIEQPNEQQANVEKTIEADQAQDQPTIESEPVLEPQKEVLTISETVQETEPIAIVEPVVSEEPVPQPALIEEEVISTPSYKEEAPLNKVVEPETTVDKTPEKKQSSSNSTIYIVIIAAAVILALVAIIKMIL